MNTWTPHISREEHIFVARRRRDTTTVNSPVVLILTGWGDLTETQIILKHEGNSGNQVQETMFSYRKSYLFQRREIIQTKQQ